MTQARSPRHGVALAHRRLAIIDLSRDGRQPMADCERPLSSSVYNGEVYNYRELRASSRPEGTASARTLIPR